MQNISITDLSMIVHKSLSYAFDAILVSHVCNLFLAESQTYVVRCAIWYHLYNLKNVKNTYGGVSILVKLQDQGC